MQVTLFFERVGFTGTRGRGRKFRTVKPREETKSIQAGLDNKPNDREQEKCHPYQTKYHEDFGVRPRNRVGSRWRKQFAAASPDPEPERKSCHRAKRRHDQPGQKFEKDLLKARHVDTRNEERRKLVLLVHGDVRNF